MRAIVVLVIALFTLCVPASTAARSGVVVEVRTLDGGGNNIRRPDWGRAGTPYGRVAPANYADGRSAMVGGPSPRYVSNRIFNDLGQDLFSENDISQWGWTWGQFVDHDFGLRDETPGEKAPLVFAANDPLEQFRNDFGAIDFARTPAAPGTGAAGVRQQINTLSSYIDGSGVYGTAASRLDWLREGIRNGNASDNLAQLLLPGGYLPLAGARGDVFGAPQMDLMGRLVGAPGNAVVAGDVRANENIALTALHTLFAREHNRIVAALPGSLSEEAKFQIARRVVGAEIQYITYNEFLPSLGVRLARYRGYNPRVDPGLSNEFATVGYRAHSMIHGEFEPIAAAGTYSQAHLDAFRAQGIDVETEDGRVTLVVPLNVAFGNPALLQSVGLGPLLRGLGAERQYKNDEQIDNQLRSVLFQVPRSAVADPSACMDASALPSCFAGVVDLGAIDIQRARDHGMPFYNELRRAYGLAPKTSFAAVTGETADRFPSDAQISAANPLDDPDILDFVELRDRDGNVLAPGSEEAKDDAVTGVRRTALAARLRGIYGSVDRLDAFVGMLAEPHVGGTEFGPLQLAIWRRQFEAVRDGDRFFYAIDSLLPAIRRAYGIDYRHTLAQIIRLDTGVTVERNVFKVQET